MGRMVVLIPVGPALRSPCHSSPLLALSMQSMFQHAQVVVVVVADEFNLPAFFNKNFCRAGEKEKENDRH